MTNKNEELITKVVVHWKDPSEKPDPMKTILIAFRIYTGDIYVREGYYTDDGSWVVPVIYKSFEDDDIVNWSYDTTHHPLETEMVSKVNWKLV